MNNDIIQFFLGGNDERTTYTSIRFKKKHFYGGSKIAYEADSANLNDAVEAVPYTVCLEMFLHTVKVFIENVRLQQKE